MAAWCWSRGRRWTSSFRAARPAAEDLTERAIGVEQSNTSVRLGDRLMLKIYRLLEPGVNPEVEVLELLTERGFAHAPLAAGSMRYAADDAEPAAAGIVQSLVPARPRMHGARMLERLCGRSGQPAGDRRGATDRRHHRGAAWRSSQARAEMHLRFPRDGRPPRPRRAKPGGLGAEGQLDRRALAALGAAEHGRLLARGGCGFAPRSRCPTAAPGALRVPHPRRLPPWPALVHRGRLHRHRLRGRARAPARASGAGRHRRCATWPACCAPSDYAAHAPRSARAAAPLRRRALADWGATPRAIPDGLRGAAVADVRALLRWLLEPCEKACYEVRYEANIRPDWTWLPLAARSSEWWPDNVRTTCARDRSSSGRCALPARRDLGRRGHQLRALQRERTRRRAVPVRRRAGASSASPLPRAHRQGLARLPARRRPGPALRLPRARALRARGRATASTRTSC